MAKSSCSMYIRLHFSIYKACSNSHSMNFPILPELKWNASPFRYSKLYLLKKSVLYVTFLIWPLHSKYFGSRNFEFLHVWFSWFIGGNLKFIGRSLYEFMLPLMWSFWLIFLSKYSSVILWSFSCLKILYLRISWSDSLFKLQTSDSKFWSIFFSS